MTERDREAGLQEDQDLLEDSSVIKPRTVLLNDSVEKKMKKMVGPRVTFLVAKAQMALSASEVSE